MKAPAVVFVEPKRMEIREMEFPEPGPTRSGSARSISGVSQGTERWALTGRYGHYDADYSRLLPVLARLSGGRRGRRRRVRGRRPRGRRPRVHDGDALRRPEPQVPGPVPGVALGYLVADADRRSGEVAPEVDLAAASLFHMAGVSRSRRPALPRWQPGDLVALIGLGMIGQMSAQAARRAGARVIATDLIPAACATPRRRTRPIAPSTRTSRAWRTSSARRRPTAPTSSIDTTGDHQHVRPLPAT